MFFDFSFNCLARAKELVDNISQYHILSIFNHFNTFQSKVCNFAITKDHHRVTPLPLCLTFTLLEAASHCPRPSPPCNFSRWPCCDSPSEGTKPFFKRWTLFYLEPCPNVSTVNPVRNEAYNNICWWLRQGVTRPGIHEHTVRLELTRWHWENDERKVL